jgi:hypothetical protein
MRNEKARCGQRASSVPISILADTKIIVRQLFSCGGDSFAIVSRFGMGKQLV